VFQDIKSSAEVKEVASERNWITGEISLADVKREVVRDINPINIIRPKGIANISATAKVKRLCRAY